MLRVEETIIPVPPSTLWNKDHRASISVAIAASNKRRRNKFRAAAQEKGEPRYSTGQPCKRGHIADRFTTTGTCIECQRNNLKLYHASPKGKLIAKAGWLKTAYGIGLEQYNELLKSQNNRCAICGDEFAKTPHLDHCHDTGKVRALLCGQCNKGIGHFRNSPERLRKAALYCEAHQ